LGVIGGWDVDGGFVDEAFHFVGDLFRGVEGEFVGEGVAIDECGDVLVAGFGGEVCGGSAIGVDGEAACADFDEEIGGFEVAVLGGEHEWGAAVGHACVDGCAVIGEGVDGGAVSHEGGDEECFVEVVAVVGCEFCEWADGAFADGDHEGDVAFLVLGEGIGALAEEPFDHGGLVADDGGHERGAFCGAAVVDGDAAAEEEVGGFLGAVGGGDVEGGIAGWVGGEGVETVGEEFFHRGGVVFAGGLEPTVGGELVSGFAEFGFGGFGFGFAGWGEEGERQQENEGK
jgi:hypothetical protein